VARLRALFCHDLIESDYGAGYRLKELVAPARTRRSSGRRKKLDLG
jgi:hypothetical protein